MARDDAADRDRPGASARVAMSQRQEVDCVSGTCAGYGSPRVYVNCQVEKNFDTLTNFPKVPDLFTVRRKVFVRVQ